MRDDKLATASIEDTVVPESRRRSNLYGVSSFKHLPRVRLEPPDARVRRDVAAVVLAAADTGGVFSSSSLQQPLVDTLRGHKHHEDLGQRPPMDQIQRLQDLVTTVPKDLGDRDEPDDANRGRKSVTKRVWRVGYANNAHSTSHGPLDGLFEPFDAVRDALQQPLARSQSAAIAYPTPQQSSAEIAADMEPFDEDAARDDMGRRTSIQRNDASACDNDKHWCPASFATIHEAYKPTTTTTPSRSSGSLARDTAKSQGFLIRRVPSDRQDALPPRARKAPLATDDRCVQQKQSLLAKAAASYARLRQRVDRVKDPTVRYALPVEDPSKQRAYRLGLDPVPSSVVETPARNDSDSSHTTATGRPCARERLRFRPRSAAGVHVPFRSLSSLSSSSLSSPHSLEPFTSVSKVAGAKRRPRSASVCYLGSSTVYCTDAPASSSGPSDTLNSDFDSVLDRERDKRRCTQSQTLSLLATRGMFHNLPLPQVFARLRREALQNLSRRLQRAQYEKMTMDEYLRSCGLAVPTSGDRALDSPTLASAVRDTTVSSSSLVAMRRVLVVTRQQFHIALEAFSLSSADVNLLFSALDVRVDDRVAVWEVMCAVKTLQDGFAELRRARVAVQARDLPRDLGVLLRQSFRIPTGTHAPSLELPETDE